MDTRVHSATPITLTAAGTWRGARRMFAVAVFVIPFGTAFGVAAIEKGMSVTQIVVMSMVVFSGAAQFASLDFWQSPVAYGSLALVALAVNARHIIMGAALSSHVNALPLGPRVFALSVLSDANFADAQVAFRDGERDVGVLLGGGLVMWVNWVAGTTIGALAGAVIGDPANYGLDVVMICFFAAIVAGQLGRDRSAILPVAVAAFVAFVTLDVLPTGWNVIVAAFAGGVVNVVRHAR